ncbi:MAG TPA: HAMP domain-containing sensor histidine kinase, partial [Bacillota bacterium]
VVKNSRTVGTVNIGFYGPFYFQDTDLAFINTLNRILLGVTVLAIFLALFIGSFMAKRLSTPIAKVIQTTREIAGGNLDARSDSRTSIMEVNQLIEAVNNLALSLKQQESLRKRLTGDMAHELRTPLATLQSHLEAMLDGIWKPDSKRLKVCHDEIMRVNRMVKDLERLAKYESDNSSLVKTRFDPAELIQQLLLNYEPEFRNKGVKLKFTADHLRIMADRDKLSQAIINLLSNALKFTPSGGEVAIRLEAGPETITIAVKDNGCGIAPEDLPYIFERFYRADKSRNRQTGGSGIGLTITKAIVEAHRGTIRVTSRVGEGTEFQILLPVG